MEWPLLITRAFDPARRTARPTGALRFFDRVAVFYGGRALRRVRLWRQGAQARWRRRRRPRPSIIASTSRPPGRRARGLLPKRWQGPTTAARRLGINTCSPVPTRSIERAPISPVRQPVPRSLTRSAEGPRPSSARSSGRQRDQLLERRPLGLDQQVRRRVRPAHRREPCKRPSWTGVPDATSGSDPSMQGFSSATCQR